MFFNNQDITLQEKYIERLKVLGAFSQNDSSSTIPYISYRAVEKALKSIFSTEGIERQDRSYDSIFKRHRLGIDVKTFVKSSKNPFGHKTEKIYSVRDLPNKFPKLPTFFKK